jgi:hypothetical protein
VESMGIQAAIAGLWGGGIRREIILHQVGLLIANGASREAAVGCLGYLE